jgi:predicted nucleic acid-binding protein
VRVVIGANVVLSFLIYPKRSTAACQVVTRAIAGDFALVFSSEIADELRSKVQEKPYVRDRIA